MRIHDLGDLPEELLLFGGIYSNLQALQALVDVARARNISSERMLCGGDVVAYCAQGEESAQSLRALGCPVLAGNCELQLAADAEDCGCGYEEGSTCSFLSRGWYAHARATVSAQNKRWMGELPDRLVFTHCAERYVMVHGAASDVARFVWPVADDAEIAREMALLEAQVGPFDHVIASHTGLPMERRIGARRWINPGAIGMPPHDGDPRGCYGVLSQGRYTQHRLAYDTAETRRAMQAAGLTQGYDAALHTGYMPSEDSFPPELHRSNH